MTPKHNPKIHHSSQNDSLTNIAQRTSMPIDSIDSYKKKTMTHRNDSIKGSTKFYKDKTIQSTLDSTLIKNNKTKITDPTELIVNKPDNKSSEIKSIKEPVATFPHARALASYYSKPCALSHVQARASNFYQPLGSESSD